MQSSARFSRGLGCDVAKAEIVIFDTASDKTSKLANTPAALAAFAATLGQNCLVICEATGGYENALLDALLAVGIAAHRADARKVKAFIRSFGTLGKTDAIDARALARYGTERQAHLPLWVARLPARQALAALVQLRRELVGDRLACSNRCQAPGQQTRELLAPLLACLAERIAAVEEKIRALLAATPELAQDIKLLRTVPGLGDITAQALLALMPELGTLNRRQAAALAGLAPHPRQSGKTDGYRLTRGGRPQIKHALFMAGLSAARPNSPFNAHYRKLIEAGKKPIVAVIAIMRKIVTIANARLKEKYATV